MLARTKARLPCLYASDARLCPVLRAGSMEASEKTYRLYSCGRCVEQVRICRDCDHGNRYCAGVCAKIRRRESLRRAGERYQLSHRGACMHADRQRAFRQRQRVRQAQIVTHHGSLPGTATLIVAAISTQTTPEETHVDIVSIQPPPKPRSLLRAGFSAVHPHAQARWHAHRLAPSAQSCSFCWRALPAFARIGPLRSGP
jgi:hypothetical protein